MPAPTCLLFFPGSRPDLLPKAVASGAGLICVDLEDAVGPEDKDAARSAVTGLLGALGDGPRLAVRINHPQTPEGRADLTALASAEASIGPLCVMVPKVDAATDLSPVLHVRATSGSPLALIPVIETARGLASVEEIAPAEGVSALLFGALDLSTELRCALEWEALLHARSRCVHAARLAGVDVYDAPFFDVRDDDGLREEAVRARRLGFDGKAAIHPGQVEAIHAAFAPDGEAIERARRIVDASERAGGGVVLVDGVMIDRPAVEAARRIAAFVHPEEN
jgi:(S)-citramalyl-CoA lyase